MGTYRIGTVTVSNGSTAVTGSGTAWVSAGIREGDFLFVNGLFGEVASVQSNTALTLVRGWPGSGASGQQYSLALIDDGQRSIPELRAVLQALGTGNLSTLSALTAAANEMPYWTGPGVMNKTALTSQARTLLGSALLSRSGNNYVFDAAARLTGGVITSSSTDTTAGRVLKVGDAGVLGNSISVEDLGAAPVGVNFRFGASATNKPGPSNAAGQGVTIGGVGTEPSSRAQIVVLHFPSTERDFVYSRTRVDNVWGPWRLVYNSSSVVGTVSQSGGVPNGAVFQRGSTPNGNFIRFADGTQICQISGLVLPFNNAATCQADWTFPAAFLTPPSVNGVLNASATSGNIAPSLDQLGALIWSNSGNNNNVARASIRRISGAPDFVSGNAITMRHVTVIGQWF